MGEGKGWISLYRNIQDHWLWQEKPYDKAHAWMDLLLSANHKDNKVLIGNELVIVKRGSFITSQLKLMEKWGWGKGKLIKFLDLISTDKMIYLYSTKKYTMVTINNYEMYQNQTALKQDVSTDSEEPRTTNGPQTDHKRTMKGPQTDHETYTNNNDNNDNNVNNDNKNKYSSNSNEFRLSQFLFNHIKQNNPKAKKPNLQSWSKQFDYIIRIDGRELEEIQSVIRWCQKDNFWRSNILSPKKLREKYDTLYLQMKGDKNNGDIGQNSKTGQGKYTGFKPPKPKIESNIDTEGLI